MVSSLGLYTLRHGSFRLQSRKGSVYPELTQARLDAI
jgi:hypothetical protein